MRPGSNPGRGTVRKRKVGYVSNKEIREAFLRSGLSTYDVASYIGWFKGKGNGIGPDTSRVERILGLRTYKNGHGRMCTNVSMSEENALKVIEALNFDPVDFREIGL